ncbi:serine/threonine-protein kinase Nek9-like isoform X1 [Haliotis rufescens]|uniref:serine/threonine-protein kinase Nek9-like isoform X1 n=1 Tax=Haliotis rufescens TaxID=6454 RepID=UPI001EB0958B|nr:serine/threonine-protein kinase Nek9-like isoform X1 [Haliotis rufescens]
MATSLNMASESFDGLHETSYVLVRVLGRGAFGEAVLYRKTEDNSLVVWKEINLAKLNEREKKDSYTEIEILSLLNHSNIVSYYNHFVDEDTLFIEMEYANGGSLFDKISHQTHLFPEEVVRWYLFQLTSALAYVHEFGIIHRDIKTMNIFLTRTDLVKLGDFGISKALESKGGMAETLVGTPYYMSPELMKGEKYNTMTDIWAMGCVLYELLTLTRTFQATNPLKLAYDIVLTEHGGIDSSYSQDMDDLVNSMLQKNPSKRPTASVILTNKLFSNAKDLEQRVWELNSSSRRARSMASTSTAVPVIKAKMCEVYQWGGGKRTPQKLDLFSREKSPVQVSAGHSHLATLTVEKELYTWANLQGDTTIVGQLGHGDVAAYKAPKRVDALIGIPIKQVDCGEDFTFCVTDEGKVYSFGSDYFGCLGTDSGDDVLDPIPVDYFSQIPVEQVSCGESHCVALSKDGDVYTWGCGEFGRLGLGSEDDCSLPQKVSTPGKHLIKSVCAGSDGTFLITTNGRLLACGSNEFNKLGFNSETSGLRKRKAKVYDIPCKYTFTTVKPLSRYNIVSVATGKTHSAVIDLYGYLFTFGSNKYGQLGLGDFKKRECVCRVGGMLAGQRVERVSCGVGFTVISTNENQIYSWGNGESGRLGAIISDQGKGPNSQCTSLPRPMFGCLHIVADISSSHWNTLLIAEKVLNQKTLKSRVSSPKYKAPESVECIHGETVPEDSAFVDDDIASPAVIPSSPHVPALCLDSGKPSTPPESAQHTAALTNSSVPPWLEAELNDAEVIPIPSCTPSPDIGGSGQLASGSSGHPSLRLQMPDVHLVSQQISDTAAQTSEHETSSQDVGHLQARIQHLEAENKKLWRLVSDQQQQIKTLMLDPEKPRTS